MHDGQCFAPATSERLTAGNASSSPRGLPTPKARDAKGPDPGREDLGHAVTLLKTPTSNLGTIGGSQHPDKRRAGGHGPNLSDEIEHLHLLPTPRASDGTHGGPNQRGSKGDLTLASATAQLPAYQAAQPQSAAEIQAVLPLWTGAEP
ncbi:hypothetical protein [Streptacidiphilus griseoplanus]|uniref:hypothetical protein n=1 Tax=Peterkaempfera griseoplana TaxID=66896 RepID=UPI001FE23C32|nr:hypothetical protein [Peterkaempfera griseoplana]